MFQGLTDQTAKDIKALPNVISIEENINPKDSATISYKLNADKSAYTKVLIPLNLFSRSINHGIRIGTVL